MSSQEIILTRRDDAWVVSDEHGEFTRTSTPETALDAIWALLKGPEPDRQVECSECGDWISERDGVLQCEGCGVVF